MASTMLSRQNHLQGKKAELAVVCLSEERSRPDKSYMSGEKVACNLCIESAVNRGEKSA